MNSNPRTSTGSPAQYQLNFRLLAISVLVFAGIGLASFFWYRFAFRKASIGFLEKARSAYGQAEQLIADTNEETEVNKQFSEAFELYWKYIQIQPTDAQALKEFAGRYDRAEFPTKNYRRAVNLYQRLIAQAQAEPENRARLAYNLVQIREYGEAEKQALKVIGDLAREENGNLANDPADPAWATAWGTMANSLLGQIQNGLLVDPDKKSKEIGLDLEVGEILVKAVDLNPNDWRLGFSVAEFWLQDKSQNFLSTSQEEEFTRQNISRTTFALKLANQVRNRNASDPMALCMSFLFKRKAEVANQAEDLNDALKIAPENPMANALLGEYLFETVLAELNAAPNGEVSGDQRAVLERSRQLWETAISGSNNTFPVHGKLGQANQLLDREDDALRVWKEGLGLSSEVDFELQYRIVEFLVDKDRLAEAEQELSTWAELIKAKSQSENPNPKLILAAQTHRTFWLAQHQLKRDQIDLAKKSFDYVLINDTADKYHSRIANLSLAAWFANHDLPQEAAIRFEAALALAPLDAAIRMACFRSHARAENWQRAKDLLQNLLDQSSSPDLYLEYANVLLQVEASRPPDERNWSELDRIVSQLGSGESGSSLTEPFLLERLLTAIMVVKSGGSGDSQLPGLREQLERLEANDTNSAIPLEQLALVLANLRENEKIEQLIQERIPKVRDVAERTVLEVKIRGRRQKEGDLATALERIRQVLPSITDVEQQISLKLLMAQTLVQQREFDEAVETLIQLQSEQNKSSRVLMELVELVIQLDRISESPSPWESSLVDIEGQSGPVQLFFAGQRKIQAVRNGLESEEVPTQELLNDLLQTLDEGKSIMSRVVNARPNWPKAHDQLGLMHHLASDINRQISQNHSAAEREKREAIASYRRALDAGGRDLRLIYRLVGLDSDPERIKQVFDLLDNRSVSLFTGLAAQKTSLAWQLNDKSLAEKVANELVETQPDDPMAWLIWGHVKAKNRELDKANQAAETALEKIPEDGDRKAVLFKIFEFYVATSLWQNDEGLRQQQVERANALIEPLVALEKPDTRSLLKARLLALVDAPQATSLFLEAEKQNPGEAQLLLILDHFLGDSRSVEFLGHAIRVVKNLSEKYPGKKEYKLQLASLLMRRGLGDDFDVARKLLQDSAAPGSVEYYRAEAIRLIQIQSMLPNTERLAALAEAEKHLLAVTDNTQSTEDRFLLAEVYLATYKLLEPGSEESNQTLEKSQKNIDALDKSATLNANQVANLANYFLSVQKDFARAQSNLDRLRVMTQTASPPFSAPYQLQVRLWKAQEVPDLVARTKTLATEFEAQIEAGNLVINMEQKSRLYVEMALIYQEADQADAALEWLRKAVSMNSGQAQQLIFSLSQNNQKVEAVNIANALYEKNPKTELIQAVVLALGSGQTPPEAFAAAQPMLDDVVQKHASDQNLLMTVGDYYAFQPGMTDKAIQFYKKALELGEQEPLRTLSLLNNLATVLGEGDQAMRLEALRLIARAESMVAQTPLALLDTKAVVLMNNGDVQQARQVLRSLVAADKDPRFWFHLAEAEWQLAATSGTNPDQRFFQTAMQNAIDGGVENTVLTPRELERWEKMKENLRSISESGPSQ